MKHFIAALLAAALASGPACAQTPTTAATAATPVHKKAAPPAKHKKATVKKERIKKSASF